MKLGIVSTGVANIASVKTAFQRLGFGVDLIETPNEIGEYPYVVLPGVGAFGAAIKRLTAAGIADAIVSRVEQDRPTLGICLGLQLLATGSDESPASVGLGIVGNRVRRMETDFPVPQIGWNEVRGTSRFFENGWAYFANSFALSETPTDWNSARYAYGNSYVASIEKGSVLACQFHPELSGDWGMSLLETWGSPC